MGVYGNSIMAGTRLSIWAERVWWISLLASLSSMVTLYINQRLSLPLEDTHTDTDMVPGSYCSSFPEGLCMWLLDSFMRHHQQRPGRLENGPRWLLQGTLALDSISLSKDEQAVVPECIFHTCGPMGWEPISGCDVTFLWSVSTILTVEIVKYLKNQHQTLMCVNRGG